MQLKSLRIFEAVCETGSFGAAAQQLHTVQSNVTAHIKKLEEAGYVAVAKSFVNNKPLTRVSITPSGRKAFAAYLEALGGLIGRSA
jgi:DNA-binding transcriptional LysR family regulator